MKKLLTNCIMGLLIAVLGVFILIKPNAFLKTLVLIFGIYVLLEGLSSIIYSFKLKSLKAVFRISLVKALLNLFIGILVCYFSITSTSAAVTDWVVYLIAIELLVSGILTFIDTIYLKKLEVTGLAYFMGSDVVVSIFFAILLFLFPHFIGTVAITIFGVIILLAGVTMMFFGILVYSKVKKVKKAVEEADKTVEGEFKKID